jgi:hypothetical protein
LTSLATSTFETASFIGSASAKRRMPLRASVRKASSMNSGLAVSQAMKRKPVERNCSGVVWQISAIARIRSHGSSCL